ncbi:MAG: hypothetical protein AB8F95_22760 [Bacteroidia bacterium]
MMYLVLLALLAMNITTEVLDAFDVLRIELKNSAAAANSTNDGFAESMKAEIQDEIDNEKKLDNKGLMTDTIPLIRKNALDMIEKINVHIKEIERLGDLDSVTGKLKKKDQLEDNKKYWMGEGDAQDQNLVEGFGPRGGGEAFKLRDDMDAYSKWVVDMYNSQLRGEGAEGKKLKLDDFLLDDHAELGPEGNPNPEYNQTWEVYNFKGPVGANIAFLEALKAKVFDREKDLLNLLNERLGVATFKVDKVVPIDAPEAIIVPAGLQFKTHLYVAMSSSQITPQFSGAGVKADAGGNSATLTMNASARVIPKGKNEGKQSYSATIRVPKATGGFEDLPVKGEFIVRKPEIVVTSASVQNLYRNCRNVINIDVPALGDLYNPKVSVEGGGSVSKSEKSKVRFSIVPTGKRAKVKVNTLTNGENTYIGDVDYKVIEPPKPNVQMLVNGKKYNGASPVPKASRIKLQISSDPEFKAALPADAKYGVSGVKILAQLSLGPPKTVGTVGGGRADQGGIKISMPTRVRQANPGTKVYVRIEGVYRQNYQNKRVSDNRFTEVERTLSLVVR